MTHEFKVGDVGKTRDGRDYRVICVNRIGDEPIIALVNNVDCEKIYSFNKQGRYLVSEEYGEDLMPPKKVGWINVYPFSYSSGTIYNTKQKANELAGISRVACIKIEYSEGEGL